MGRGKKIVLATVGSLGDLHPFIALALALRRRGHRPVIATHGSYRAKVEAEGLDFHPMRPDEDDYVARLNMDIGAIFERMTRDPDFLITELQIPFLAMAHEDALAVTADADLVIAHSMAYGGLLAAEARGVPLVRAALTPIFLQSASDPSVTGPAPYALRPRSGLAVGYNRLVRELVRRRLKTMMRPLHAFRREIGLPPTDTDYFFDFGRPDEAAAVIGLYSPRFAPAQPDHPRDLMLAGFPVYDSEAGGPPVLDPRLAAFLEAGAPPIVFSLGSFAVYAPGDFYRTSLEAARALGRRAVLLAGTEEAKRLADLAGPDAFVGAYAPHSLVFSRAAAIVHHGGIGTTGQALRAGKPQLVAPFLGDQPDNARRLADLGVARWIKPSLYDAARAKAELGALLGKPRYADTARVLASEFRAEDGAEAAARHVETLLA